MPDPEAPSYEPADPEDLPAAWQVYLACTDPGARDATRRPDPAAPEVPPPLYAHLLATCEGAFWVARVRDQVVALAAATTRGRVWFVSELWVAPGFRGQGIGSRLLRLLKRSGRGLRGRIRAALAGDDGASLALALGDGMQVRSPIFRLAGDPGAAERLWSAPGRPARARLAACRPAGALGPRSPLARLDLAARGTVRPMDHAFWLSRPDQEGFLVWIGPRPAAYFYVSGLGEVGPVAAAGPAGLDLALRHAVQIAARRAGRAVLRVPAISGEALRRMLGAGFRLTGGALLLASEEFGRLDRYLPGDDSLF
jgi:GNAT superfamily N-acetyltransferase